MRWRLLKAVLLLPGNALIVIPALILWAASGTAWAAAMRPASMTAALLALLFALAGLVLMIWTMLLFATRGGGGTPAPWDPVVKLVTGGPYRHVRNPMLTGVILFLAAEALWLASWPLFGWAALFTAINAAYFPLSEEPRLEARYGEAYRQYKRNVPRWLPRLKAWTPEGGA